VAITFEPGVVLAAWQGWIHVLRVEPGGQDLGPLFFLAEPFNRGATLRTVSHSKRLEFDGTTTYLVFVQNTGDITTSYRISGGGVT
jgi:hypothetical protein